MTTRSVLVLGAQGRFGQAAVQAFAAAGWRVLAQARRPLQGVPRGVEAVAEPLADGTGLAARARGARAVVYAVNPAYTDWRREMLPLARQGMEVASRLGALFMLPGNVYGYGDGMSPRLHEDTPERPTTVKGRLRQTLEAELAARARGDLHSVVIRAGDFYGAGAGSWFDLALVKSLRRGRLVYPGPLDLPHAWAYLPDLARAFVAVAAADDGRTPHRRLHFAGHSLTGAQMLDAIEAAAGTLGVRPAAGFRRGGMPWGLIHAGGLLVPTWREIAEMAYLWRVPHALDGHALEAAAGPLAATPPAEAIRAALADLGFGPAASAAGVAAPVG